MNKFKEGLRTEIEEKLNQEEIQGYKNRIANEVYEAIKSCIPADGEERTIQIDYMMTIDRFLKNYDELKPIVKEYFDNEKER